MKTIIYWIWLIIIFLPAILSGQCLETLNSEIPKSNYEICFINKNKGWKAYVNGEVYTTNDQGENWELIATLPDDDLGLRLLFINRDTGFISGDFGVFISTDGGYNWELKNGGEFVPPTYDQDGRLYFLNRKKLSVHDVGLDDFYTFNLEDNVNRKLTFFAPGKGYLFNGEDAIFDIEDGAIIDTAFTFHEGTIHSFHFLNKMTGFVLTTNSEIFKTVDGGWSWQFVTSIDENDLSEAPAEMYFQNDSKAVIHLNREGKIIRTSDAWVNWEKFSIPSRNHYPINFCKDGSTWYHNLDGFSFFAENDFYPLEFKDLNNHGNNRHLAIVNDSIIMTAGSFLTRSTDNGETFKIDSSFFDGYSVGLEFPDSDYGFLARQDTLYFSSNHGKTWEILWTSPYGNIQYFHFFDKETGLIQLFSGEILKSSDSGRTWTFYSSLPSNNLFTTPDYLDENHLALVEGSILYFTRDGGNNWIPRFYNPFGRIKDIKWVDPNHIVLLFNDRIVLYYVLAFEIWDQPLDVSYDHVAILGEHFILYGNNAAIGYYHPGLNKVVNLDPLNDYQTSCNGLVIDPNTREVILGGSNGFLAKIRADQGCHLKLPDYFQDSTLAAGDLFEWEDTASCYQLNILSIQDQFGNYIIKDSILLENKIKIPDSVKNKPGIKLEIGFTSPWDTTYCFSKSYQNLECQQTISRQIKVCEGHSFTFRGITYGLGLHSLIIDGTECDTTFFFQVITEEPVSATRSITLCDGETFFHNGFQHIEPFSFIDTLLTIEGCDSIFLTTQVAFEGATPNTWVNWESDLAKNPENLFFLDENTAYCSTYSDDILKSIDGGRTWEPRSSFTQIDIKELFFLNEDLGWALCKENLLLKLRNDGRFHDTLPLPMQEKINSIHFLNEQVGFAVGEKGHISKTTDGGQTWQQQNTPETAHLTGEFFFDENNGFVFGREGSLNYTNDGGQTWTIRFPYFNHIVDLKFLNRDTGFAIVKSAIILTTDKGLSWEVFPWERNATIRKGAFLFDGSIIIYTNLNEIYISNDLGQSWELMDYAPTFSIYTWFTDNKHFVWFSNYFSHIYKYGPTEIKCPQNVLLPSDSNQLISVYQEFVWESVYPCVDGYKLNFGLGNNPVNLIQEKDIGYNNNFKYNRILPFDTNVLLTINPYIIEGNTGTCPPLTFRTCPFIGDSIKVDICYGDTFSFRGSDFTEDTQVYWSWSLPEGCDSFVVLDLKVHNPLFITIDTTLRPGDTFLGNTLQSDTLIYENLVNQYGCDSTTIYNISVDRSSVKSSRRLTGLNVFPNPTDGKVFLQFNTKQLESPEVLLFNILGHTQYQLNTHTLQEDLFELAFPQGLTTGIYFLKIKTASGFYLEKISLTHQ